MQNENRLDVIDFGGSLGSTYRQCRPFLDGLASVRWSVIEQASFVQAGRDEFSTDELRFFGSVAALQDTGRGGVVLLASVLQYLEDPRRCVDELAQTAARHLVIDRTPFSAQHDDRLCIQRVPRHLYAASYPCWILSRTGLLAHLSPHWRLVAAYGAAEGTARTDDGLAFEFQGLILERAA
jgi:putative methyltransferase (TIGR04325 family)